MEQKSDEKFWTAKEWAIRSRLPYRAILSAAASGELAAVRPSGTTHGAILISESSWRHWLGQIGLRTRVPGPVSATPGRESRPLSDLALP